MQVKKNVYSSNIEFKQQEVNIDTVFTRFDEKKLYDEDGVHIGWRYNEIWEDKDEFLERVSKENKMLSEGIMDLTTKIYLKNIEMEEAVMELTNLLGGM